VAFVPDGDLFAGITSGRASVVTDEIASFDERGVLLLATSLGERRTRAS